MSVPGSCACCFSVLVSRMMVSEGAAARPPGASSFRAALLAVASAPACQTCLSHTCLLAKNAQVLGADHFRVLATAACWPLLAHSRPAPGKSAPATASRACAVRLRLDAAMRRACVCVSLTRSQPDLPCVPVASPPGCVCQLQGRQNRFALFHSCQISPGLSGSRQAAAAVQLLCGRHHTS